MGFEWVGSGGKDIPNQPDCKKEHLAHLNLDFTKNLNDQGYYGSFPNDADPRTSFRLGDETVPERKEYQDWVNRWIEAHNGVFDNHQMYLDRRKEVHAKIIAERRARGDMSSLVLEYW